MSQGVQVKLEKERNRFKKKKKRLQSLDAGPTPLPWDSMVTNSAQRFYFQIRSHSEVPGYEI
jgi:hypothetical protein